MNRLLRWGIGVLLVSGLALGALFLLPFNTWLPGGTVADVPTREVVNGTAFNRLFPAAQSGEELVFTQEKRGFSEARLRRDGEVKALLAISDTITSPSARDKFSGSGQRLKGWPLVEQGQQASALLVADRFQVKVIGQGKGLDPQQRHDLIGAFDLSGLAALAPSSRTALKPSSGKALQPSSSRPAPQPSAQPVLEPAR